MRRGASCGLCLVCANSPRGVCMDRWTSAPPSSLPPSQRAWFRLQRLARPVPPGLGEACGRCPRAPALAHLPALEAGAARQTTAGGADGGLSPNPPKKHTHTPSRTSRGATALLHRHHHPHDHSSEPPLSSAPVASASASATASASAAGAASPDASSSPPSRRSSSLAAPSSRRSALRLRLRLRSRERSRERLRLRLRDGLRERSRLRLRSRERLRARSPLRERLRLRARSPLREWERLRPPLRLRLRLLRRGERPRERERERERERLPPWPSPRSSRTRISELSNGFLNVEPSSLRRAYFMSSSVEYSTTPVPSRRTSVNPTSPASRMWSLRSCHDAVRGSPLTTTRNWERRGGPRGPLPPPRAPRPRASSTRIRPPSKLYPSRPRTASSASRGSRNSMNANAPPRGGTLMSMLAMRPYL
mmetsp:Transcript_28074/g.90680  ORF Transcript_28074/g.90680 Transcript_28074/m.90680 type:complete len:421 (+) Transcript_28074:112-1374(+)